MSVVVPEVAHQMALLPLVWLGVLYGRGQRRDAAWWWLAAAFAVSWVADSLAHVVDPWFVSAVYPVTQAAIVCAVLTSRRTAGLLVTVLVVVGVAAVLGRGVQGPDILLHTMASGTVVVVVWPLPLGRLRATLLVAFGLTGLCWLAYTAWPGWTSWGLFQGARALGIGLWCWAVSDPRAVLRVVR